MANTTIPKQHYVTIQYRKDTTVDSSHLGFASPYTKDAAFKKRKETQDSWAYGRGTTVTIDENDDITVVGGGRQGGYGHMEVDAATLFMTNCYPLIINNDLIEGFEIAKSVKRGGSWGPGNVVWRIADPRGFELEISSSNFANVLGCVTIVNGMIQGKCVWGRNGKDNVLLPEASDVYQEANKLTVKINKNISLKDVKVGDTVELMNAYVDNKDTYQYLGKYFFLLAEKEIDDAHHYSGIFFFNKRQVERYLLKSKTTGKYIVVRTPKILSIVESVVEPLDKMEIAKEVTAWLNRENRIPDIPELILVSPIKIKPAEVTTQLVPLCEIINQAEGWPVIGYSTDTIISEFDGKFWIANREQTRDNRTYTYEYHPVLNQIDVSELPQNKLSIKITFKSRLGHYNGGRELVTRKDFTFDQLKMYRAEVTANGITGKVFNLGYY